LVTVLIEIIDLRYLFTS